MERTMSVEEKIRRAEEIYARRHELDNRNINKNYVSHKEKKDMKLFKKLFLQMIACLLIYLVFFTIKNNNYIFTEDFINKTKEILSYDINFEEIYQNISNYISGLIQNDKTINNSQNSDNNINNTEEEVNKNEENKPENPIEESNTEKSSEEKNNEEERK